MTRLGLALLALALAACANAADGQEAATAAVPLPPPPPAALARDRTAWLADLEAACSGIPITLGCELWAECKVSGRGARGGRAAPPDPPFEDLGGLVG